MKQHTIQQISKQIVTAQQPIRLLDAIKWDDDVRARFYANNANELPEVTSDYYQRTALDYSLSNTREQFRQIISRIDNELDSHHPITRLMRKTCYEYLGVLDLIEFRGTSKFFEISKNLFGHTAEAFHQNGPNLAHLGEILDDSLANIDRSMFLEKAEKTIPTQEALRWLRDRFKNTFSASGRQIHIIESDGIVADAAAGSDYIKLRKNAFFSIDDLRVLEVHEGWVHVGTTINGQNQTICSFLSKGTPSCTVTQEGLAVFIEIISFCSHPARLQRISDRIRGITMAEQGANFLEIYRYLIDAGRHEDEAYTTTMRIFRGSTPAGKPFTKDLAYAKGFIDVYNFIRLAVRHGKLHLIELLFCGKVSVNEMETIAIAASEGLISKPVFLPPNLTDLSALTSWMAFSNFLNRLDLTQIEEDFASALATEKQMDT